MFVISRTLGAGRRSKLSIRSSSHVRLLSYFSIMDRRTLLLLRRQELLITTRISIQNRSRKKVFYILSPNNQISLSLGGGNKCYNKGVNDYHKLSWAKMRRKKLLTEVSRANPTASKKKRPDGCNCSIGGLNKQDRPILIAWF